MPHVPEGPSSSGSGTRAWFKQACRGWMGASGCTGPALTRPARSTYRAGMDFTLSTRCREYQERLLAFMDSHVYPNESVYEEQLHAAGNPHAQPPIMEQLKKEAQRRGLWNLFHPHKEWGPGLSNAEY